MKKYAKNYLKPHFALAPQENCVNPKRVVKVKS